MSKRIIIIAGIPASGKTHYGMHISAKMKLPFISKDWIKEKLYDTIQYDTSIRENSKLYGAASYSVFFHIAECLMKADISFIFESNFTPSSADILIPLLDKYGYNALTILFDADMKILHKRFCQRDITDERHPGLKSTSNVFIDFNYFQSAVLPIRNFSVGERIVVDTTDFSKVDYNNIDSSVKNFLLKNN